MARRPSTHLRLSEATRHWLAECRTLAWLDDPQSPRAYDSDAVLRPMLQNRARRLRQRARRLGYDPDELLRMAAGADSGESGAGFNGLPVKSPRVDE